MEESDLLKYIEDRFSCIEHRLSEVEALFEPISKIVELHAKLHNQTNTVFNEVDHRCESIESAMEKMLDILHAHDDLLSLPV